jgi:hypothetical protein
MYITEIASNSFLLSTKVTFHCFSHFCSATGTQEAALGLKLELLGTALFTHYLTDYMTYSQLPSISPFHEPKSMPYNGDKDSYLTWVKTPNEIALSL